jgi:hypothetical protein
MALFERISYFVHHHPIIFYQLEGYTDITPCFVESGDGITGY